MRTQTIFFRKHSLLIGILLASILLFIAIRKYPGGSQANKYSTGFDWNNNYLCNLFDPQAINGENNPSRYWAIAGMLIICSSFGNFFFDFSGKISSRKDASIIKFSGIASMVFGFLIVTPFHNQMIIISSLFALISISYITIYIFKSRLYFIKSLCLLCLFLLFSCNFIYYSKIYLEYLPIIQKTALFLAVLWIILLHYFSDKSDFVKSSPNKLKNQIW